MANHVNGNDLVTQDHQPIQWSIVSYCTMTQGDWNSHNVLIYDQDDITDTDLFVFPIVAFNINIKYKSDTEHNDFKTEDQHVENQVDESNASIVTKTQCDTFIRRLIDVMSHPMFGCTYKTIIGK